ncbi:HAD family hydrolase [Labilibaculum euxinus]|uniref:HAD hydrolase-like protein n=1 Tax=Labilibaculum euxinus TaxID=2686357 RepID=A0A7M4D8Q3_9BACT|nr:HAD family hydrolase [Labilibaculum euxinus]MUP39032.1 HAD hydrolase-like protein [Labilibaculum euxinus]MVB08237.1 HAD hydrolase-like protein [Labilibaculum euxinus]
MNGIKVIAFDADDTLWVNEPYFRESEMEFCNLMKNGMSLEEVTEELFATEISNIPLYGYGTKAFILSMIETSLKITKGNISSEKIQSIIELGKRQMNKSIELIDGVVDVLESLQGKYKLIVATKGDLLDQERKLKKSGLLKYFHHIEVMSDKREDDYKKLIQHLDIPESEFLMVGNSLKSDVLPVLNLGGKAVHVPFHTTWEHELVSDEEIKTVGITGIQNIRELLQLV